MSMGLWTVCTPILHCLKEPQEIRQLLHEWPISPVSHWTSQSLPWNTSRQTLISKPLSCLEFSCHMITMMTLIPATQNSPCTLWSKCELRVLVEGGIWQIEMTRLGSTQAIHATESQALVILQVFLSLPLNFFHSPHLNRECHKTRPVGPMSTGPSRVTSPSRDTSTLQRSLQWKWEEQWKVKGWCFQTATRLEVVWVHPWTTEMEITVSD